MKQFAIIGLSKFGQRMLEELADTGCELILIDKDENSVFEIENDAVGTYFSALDQHALDRAAVGRCAVET